MKSISLVPTLLAFAGAGVFVTSRTSAQPISVAPIVKVYSDLCGGETPLEGSGILFSSENAAYVLTSEHVVLHGQSGFCHRIEHMQLGTFTVKLKVADWGRGTAILSVVGFPSPELLPSIDELAQSSAQQGRRVTTIGFPAGQTIAFSSDLGNILATDSPRHFLAHSEAIVELLNSHGEFGMSGGGVFDNDTGNLVAMLSHQYLKMVEGNRTLVGDFRGQSGGENHLLAIAIDEIRPWLNNALAANATDDPLFVRDPLSQLEGDDVVIADGLRFKASPNPEHCPDRGFVNSQYGISKSDVFLRSPKTVKKNEATRPPDFAANGGDPVGIGGIPIPGHGPIKVEVSFAENPVDTRWYLPALSQWVGAMRQHLNRRDKVDISYLLYRNSETGGLRKICVSSLSEFFRKLTSPDVNPVTLLSSQLGEPLPAVRTLIINLAGQLSSYAKEFQHQAQAHVETQNEARRRRLVALRLSNELATVAEVLAGDNWPFVDPNDFDRYMEDQGETGLAWRYFYDLDWDKAVELKVVLKKLRESMEKVRL